MSCCGNNRQLLARRDAAGPAVAPGPASAKAPEPPARGQAPSGGVFFVYYGAAELVMVGSASGRRYRFAERGARLAVDARDAPALAANPRLRRLGPGA